MRSGNGFTLIELSIVLVIIGLIVGGVLVGQDLIVAAGIRGQITQIEKFQTAMNTFRGKYGYPPGDIPDPAATQYGFTAAGDGDGIITCGFSCAGEAPAYGESGMFWKDLSDVKLIEGAFAGTGPDPAQAFPAARIGRGNYLYLYVCDISPGPGCGVGPSGTSSGLGIRASVNYFSLSVVTYLDNGSGVGIESMPGMTVNEAYNIDKKIDDGFPQTGRVFALYLNDPVDNSMCVAHGGSQPGFAGTIMGPSDQSATPGAADTCMDNNNVGGAVQKYTMGFNGGAGVNCALSFRFQ